MFADGGHIRYVTIGESAPRGICGSGIIDLVSVLLNEEVINRSGVFIDGSSDKLQTVEGIKRFVLADKDQSEINRPIFVTESDIENIITAKAAIFAAIKILLERVDLSFYDIQHFYIAGAFGNYIDINHAINIGLVPNIPNERIHFVGNTSIKGAKAVALYKKEFDTAEQIMEMTTYYDLMGADDYVDEFMKALFLPHTDIEMFWRTT